MTGTALSIAAASVLVGLTACAIASWTTALWLSTRNERDQARQDLAQAETNARDADRRCRRAIVQRNNLADLIGQHIHLFFPAQRTSED